MLLYAVTIFLSAFLLFQVQPLIAKIILPWFGGSAAVWSAAMMFFQLSLLAGYGYAHFLGKAKARTQMMVHGGLLLASCFFLPILPSATWKPDEVGDPTLRIVMLLAATIGLPYFILSSTTPLLQVWYVRRTGNQVPYRLFALSNFGSMLALLSFPFLVEPSLTSPMQAYTWSGLYVAFALLCGYAAWASQEAAVPVAAPVIVPTEVPVEVPVAETPAPSFGEMGLWVALAACASTLLVSVTNHLSANVAPIPLLWVVPLALYLLSFILSFESDKIYQRWLFVPWVAPALGWMAYSIYAAEGNYHIKYSIPIFSIGLFLCCMLCHGELALRKPAARYLTSFYLMISVGGALGGIFVALIAPNVFKTFLELPIALTACGVLAVIALWDVDIQFKGETGLWAVRFVLAIGVGLLGGYLARMEAQDQKGYHLMVRNFYGALRVRDDDVGTEYATRNLLHGTINHGSERLTEADKYKVGSYYGLNSGIGRTMTEIQSRGPIRYGVVGLGAGVMSGYARKGDYVRIYEINPIVPVIAKTEFNYFPHSEADKDILMGDARLVMEKQPSPQYDVLVIDAFSSDAIPVHLLTKESFQLYGKLLKPNGVLAVHISNRYLDLAPVCQKGADALGRKAMVVYDEGDQFSNSTTWVLITADEALFQSGSFNGANIYPPAMTAGFKAWTDDYSNIVSILSLN
ncbi:MAG: fused MFS/spermidine synthase [Bryobacteraceae bacterium]